MGRNIKLGVVMVFSYNDGVNGLQTRKNNYGHLPR